MVMEIGRELENLECELADALESMVECSCPDMLPFWLEGTKKLRKRYFDSPASEFPDHLRRKSASFHSKYKCLARWRHGVIWTRRISEEELDGIEETEATLSQYERDAMDAIYFTPCENRPPYSYSQKKSDSPRIRKFQYSEEEILDRSVLAILDALRSMKERWEDLEGSPEADFLWEAFGYKTLNDILKLKDYDESLAGGGRFLWEPPARRDEDFR